VTHEQSFTGSCFSLDHVSLWGFPYRRASTSFITDNRKMITVNLEKIPVNICPDSSHIGGTPEKTVYTRVYTIKIVITEIPVMTSP
ncbi:hypothetical protein ACYR0R_001081, partial [Escherichia coli]